MKQGKESQKAKRRAGPGLVLPFTFDLCLFADLTKASPG
jgi:hypothetical protein